MRNDYLPGPQKYVKYWPNTSNKSPTGELFTYFWGPGITPIAGFGRSLQDQKLALGVAVLCLNRSFTGKRPVEMGTSTPSSRSSIVYRLL